MAELPFRCSESSVEMPSLRSLLIGILLLPLAYVLWSIRDFPGRMVAERVRATGDITVMAKTDDRVRETFAKVRSTQRGEAGLDFVKADRQTRKHEVWLIAPTRDEALAQLEALLAAFRTEHGGEFGKDIWTFTSAYVPHVRDEKVRAWDTGMLAALGGMLALAAGLILRGVVRLRREIAAEKARIAALPPVEEESDEEEPEDAPER